ncbi:MAG: c-type cytochrome [Bryobacterales bacterium]|nr:c-type cytochrome [Acidobacteriota bacterium]MCB9383881.1 c-type cytochrome [Bryobacterales bacterium]
MFPADWSLTMQRPIRQALPPLHAVVVVLSVAVSAIAQDRTVNLLDRGVIANGAALFQKNCAVGYCHGSEGRAARGPALRDREWIARDLYGITHGGLPGTSMPAWKDVLPPEEIWAITAYVMTLAKTPIPASEAVITLDAHEEGPAALTGEAKRGEELFFDLTRQKRCGLCHLSRGKGTSVGPNLAGGPEKSAAEWLEEIHDPDKERATGFELTEATTRAGETIRGVLVERTAAEVKIYDTSTLPPVLRSLPASQVRRIRTRKGRSPMPGGWDKVYSADELQAIVAFLGQL